MLGTSSSCTSTPYERTSILPHTLNLPTCIFLYTHVASLLFLLPSLLLSDKGRGRISTPSQTAAVSLTPAPGTCVAISPIASNTHTPGEEAYPRLWLYEHRWHHMAELHPRPCLARKNQKSSCQIRPQLLTCFAPRLSSTSDGTSVCLLSGKMIQ